MKKIINIYAIISILIIANLIYIIDCALKINKLNIKEINNLKVEIANKNILLENIAISDQKINSNFNEKKIKKILDNLPLTKYNKTINYLFPVIYPENSFLVNAEAEFGYRNKNWFHTGIDIVSPFDYRVIAAENGIIEKIGYNNEFGNYILIEHTNFYSFYAHLSFIEVKKNEKINRGQRIGIIGNTGSPKYTTGYHLHFEIRKLIKGKWLYINPVCNSLHKKRVCIEY